VAKKNARKKTEKCLQQVSQTHLRNQSVNICIHVYTCRSPLSRNFAYTISDTVGSCAPPPPNCWHNSAHSTLNGRFPPRVSGARMAGASVRAERTISFWAAVDMRTLVTVSASACSNRCVYMYVCLYMYKYTYVYAYIYIYIYIYTYSYVYVYMYIFIHIYIYTYI